MDWICEGICEIGSEYFETTNVFISNVEHPEIVWSQRWHHKSVLLRAICTVIWPTEVSVRSPQEVCSLILCFSQQCHIRHIVPNSNQLGQTLFINGIGFTVGMVWYGIKYQNMAEVCSSLVHFVTPKAILVVLQLLLLEYVANLQRNTLKA